MSEGLHNSAYMQSQIQRSGERLPSIGDWSAQDAQRHLPHPAPGIHIPQTSQSDMNHIPSSYRSQLSPNGTAPPLWRYGQPDSGRRESVTVSLESGEMRAAEHDHHDGNLEWDEDIVDEYGLIFKLILLHY